MPFYDELVLSGGSIKTISTLGALQYCLDKKYIDGIDKYTGTSAGAIIMYLMIIGYTPYDLLLYVIYNDVFKDFSYYDVISLFKGNGGIQFLKLQYHLEALTIQKIGKLITLEELYERTNKKLTVVTFNCTKQITEYVSYLNYPEMPCIVALRMTSSLPYIFDRFRYMDCLYVDGLFGDGFPITHETESKHKLGIMIDFIKKKDPDNLGNIIEGYYTLFKYKMQQITENEIKNTPNIDVIRVYNQIDYFDFKLERKEYCKLFTTGYELARDYFENE